MKRFFIELISLSTPRGRLSLWALVTLILYIVPYQLISHLSLWQKIGLENAPSIGLTRAYWLLIRGDFSAAWSRNKLIYLVVMVGGIILIIDLYKLFKSASRSKNSNYK
ncbi:DUF2752 domain-containing protein [Candidatus Nomurabacteria bacterium]|nr:DUF2752 domain-containing protein [Candidatus Nomurabacteria bacterium]